MKNKSNLSFFEGFKLAKDILIQLKNQKIRQIDSSKIKQSPGQERIAISSVIQHHNIKQSPIQKKIQNKTENVQSLSKKLQITQSEIEQLQIVFEKLGQHYHKNSHILQTNTSLQNRKMRLKAQIQKFENLLKVKEQDKYEMLNKLDNFQQLTKKNVAQYVKSVMLEAHQPSPELDLFFRKWSQGVQNDIKLINKSNQINSSQQQDSLKQGNILNLNYKEIQKQLKEKQKNSLMNAPKLSRGLCYEDNVVGRMYDQQFRNL